MLRELPKYHETFTPILETLQDKGEMYTSELRKVVRDTYYANLPKEQLELKIKSGDPLILNRIAWGKAYLKQAKLVEQPQRGKVRISDKGRRALKEGKVTLEDLLSDSDFLAHREAVKERSEVGAPVSSNESPEDLVDAGVRALETQVKADLLERLKSVDPFYFERVILMLFQKMGYGDFEETKRSGDGGIDGIINQDQLGIEKIYTQAKRYSENKVREPEIRNFIGAMAGGTTRGIFVTTSEFDDAAVKKARESHNTIILIDGHRLVDLMYRFGVGMQIKNTYEIKEIDEDFFESD